MPKLSKNLGVSITPIREALTQLHQSNIVKSVPNRGFFLGNLNKREAMEIYPIIASLEQLAVSESVFSPTDVKKLRDIQNRMTHSENSKEKVDLDFKFHDVLLGNYENGTLKGILNDLKIRLYLYEFNYRKVPELNTNSSNHHLKIITALSNNKMNKAANLVKENWLTSVDFIKNKL
jgi:DNA-binding GntR family transcriptional regulator